MNRTLATLTGLFVGIAAGALTATRGWAAAEALAAAKLVGTLWLDALRMTVLPLVVTLTATGTARAIAAASGGAVIRRAALLGFVLLVASAGLALIVGPLLLSAWTPDPATFGALRGGGLPPAARLAGSGDALLGFIAPNLAAAAAEGAIPPLAIFALLFGAAAARLPAERTRTALDALGQVADIVLVIVGWVLALAPIGVAALGFALGTRLGLGAGAALAAYVGTQIAVTVVLGGAMVGLAALGGRIASGRFIRAALEPQAVAASTQSSLAALPAMLTAAARLTPGTEPGDVRCHPPACRRAVPPRRARVDRHRHAGHRADQRHDPRPRDAGDGRRPGGAGDADHRRSAQPDDVLRRLCAAARRRAPAGRPARAVPCGRCHPRHLLHRDQRHRRPRPDCRRRTPVVAYPIAFPRRWGLTQATSGVGNQPTVTPFQNAMRSRIFSALALGSG